MNGPEIPLGISDTKTAVPVLLDCAHCPSLVFSVRLLARPGWAWAATSVHLSPVFSHHTLQLQTHCILKILDTIFGYAWSDESRKRWMRSLWEWFWTKSKNCELQWWTFLFRLFCVCPVLQTFPRWRVLRIRGEKILRALLPCFVCTMLCKMWRVHHWKSHQGMCLWDQWYHIFFLYPYLNGPFIGNATDMASWVLHMRDVSQRAGRFRIYQESRKSFMSWLQRKGKIKQIGNLI